MRFPEGHSVLSSIVGGSFDKEYSTKINGRRVVGHLKIAWPQELVCVVRRPLAGRG